MANNQLIDEMLIALKANIEYLQSEGNQQIKISNGKYIGALGDFHIYRFEIPPLKEIETDQDIEVKINFSTVSGKVISASNDQIEVKLEKHIGESIAEAYLIVTNYFLLQKLVDKLTEIKEGKLKVADTAEKLFQLKEYSLGNKDSVSIPLMSLDKLDEDKVKGIKLCLSSEVSFIWGPPGTGKTKLISALIDAITSQNQSVLLLSHTNKATDGALLKTLERLKDNNSSVYLEGKILRIGKIFDPELQKYKEITPEHAIDLKAKPLMQEVEALTQKISNIEDKLSKAKEDKEKCEKLARLEALKSEALRESSTLTIRKNEIESETNNINRQIESINNRINQYHESGFLGRFIKGLNLDKLTADKSSFLIKLEHSNNSISEVNKKITYNEKLQRDTNSEIEILKDEIGEIDYSKFEQDIRLLEVNLKNLSQDRSALLKKIEELATTVIKEALVIGTTLTKSYLSKQVLSRPYDCVIVDEASMAPMPSLWCAACLANQRITIIGDFLQLSPIAQYKQLKNKHKTEAELQTESKYVEKWLKNDIFRQLNILGYIKTSTDIPFLQQLRYQYRMHPDIAELINQLVYGTYGSQYTLKSTDATINNGIDRLTKEPLPNSHIGIVDTSEIGSIAVRMDNGSRYNVYNALIAVQLAIKAIENGYDDIGIISPFRAEINLIKKILDDYAKQDQNILQKITADTVHKFQGDEKQIIIFDTVTADPTKLTDDSLEHGEDEQLMNVAFSRAQEKCIVITDVSKVEKKHSSSSVLRKFIEYCKSKSYPITPCKGIIKDYPIDEKEEIWLERLNKVNLEDSFNPNELFNQDSFYPAFIKDIFTAEKEIIIISPFITHERINTFIPIFNYLIRQGIRIIIATRSPKLHDDNLKQQSKEIIKELEDIGITVLPLPIPIHQKLAFVDRKIIWEGSLNILSQRNSYEIMRRFVGSDAAGQLLSFLGFDKNLGNDIEKFKLQRCEHCKDAGAWYWNARSVFGGFWTYCLVGGHRVGKEPLSEAEIKEKKQRLSSLRHQKKEYDSNGVPICPDHQVKMILKKGKWGKDFWGCPKYPRCRITESSKI